VGQKKNVKQIAKFLAYVLGRRPDEFGLVPDAEGFVKINTLLQALSEEPGWGFLRRAHLNEIIAVFPEPVIEIRENRIRAMNRGHLTQAPPAIIVSPQLFICIRRRAYAHVLEKGLCAAQPDRLLLSDSRDMAVRIGRRMDPDAVLLTVTVHAAQQKGVIFFKAGDSLYLADQIPLGCFSGPPLPKETTAMPSKPEKTPDRRVSAGSFFLDLGPKNGASPAKGKTRGGKGLSWKRDRKRLRKEKEKLRLKGDSSFALGDIWGEDG